MGDRNNPIKFGPEWLRNLAQERSGVSVNTTQNSTTPTLMGSGQGANVSTGTMNSPGTMNSSVPSGSTGATVSAGGIEQGSAACSGSNASASSRANSRNSTNNVPKIQLANLRYGREEMLALYDRNTEPPEELKYFELLYQSRGKPPFALNSTFEEEMQRETNRGTAPVAATSRSPGRASNENRGRSRPFARHTSNTRGTSWHVGNTRVQSYHPISGEDTSPLRPWGANNGHNPMPRPHTEQQEWSSNRIFRRRSTNNTNWRQPHVRDGGDEWRSPDAARNRPNVDRDWGERPVQDRPQSWNSNRRNWGGENDENLPEWAVDNAVGGAGTFDSTGAFHGYNNEDTNIPKTPEASFPLVRSQTYGSFARSKTVEEGLEDWWSSEKAKKLSPKKFETTSDAKPKQPSNTESSEASTAGLSKQEETQEEIENGVPDSTEKPTTAAEFQGSTNIDTNNKDSDTNAKFTESKTFDALMRSDIDLEKVTDERGNFQSVMITTNNTLRQKHQNIVTSATEMSRQGRIPALQMLHTMSNDDDDTKQMSQQLIDNMFDLTVDDSKVSTASAASVHPNTSGSQTENRLPTQTSSGVPISVQNPGVSNHNLTLTSTKTTADFQGPTSYTPRLLMTNKHSVGMPAVGVHVRDIQLGVMQGRYQSVRMQPTSMQSGTLQSGGIHSVAMQSSQVLQQSLMQQAGMQHAGMQQAGMQQASMQQAGMQQAGMHQAGMQQVMQQVGMQAGSMQAGGMQSGRMPSSMLQAGGLQGGIQVLHAVDLESVRGMATGLQNVGISNSALNSSLGLLGNNGLVLPMHAVQGPLLRSSMSNSGLGPADMPAHGSMMPEYHHQASGLSVMGGGNIHNSSLFLGQNNNSMQPTDEVPMASHAARAELYQMQQNQQVSYGQLYNILPPTQSQTAQNNQNSADQWYYEDPEGIVQGPFTSKEMFNWLRAGFFSANLMVRRACDVQMSPLGSYGSMPFGEHLDLLTPYPVTSGYEATAQASHDMLNQQALGLDDALWGQPTQPADMLWLQQPVNASNDHVNNLPIYFWDTPQRSALASNSLLPEEIVREMKTEDEILAQIRASQNLSTSQAVPFTTEQSPISTTIGNKQGERYSPNVCVTPNLEELQKFIQTESIATTPATTEQAQVEDELEQVKLEKLKKLEQILYDNSSAKQQPQSNSKTKNETKSGKTVKVENETKLVKTVKVENETKSVKTAKVENEKTVKNKENNSTKTKNKKPKEEKKEHALETKNVEEDSVKIKEKRCDESSPSKSKKEDKQNKKEIEKERKEWVKEGFTIVKGSEKGTNKDSKKKVEDTKNLDNAERKRKEKEKVVADEKKEKKTNENQKKSQGTAEAIVSARRAPWSGAATQQAQAVNRESLSLTDIQRHEREKKIEQIKMQQQMMNIIAQQQAATLAREQIRRGIEMSKLSSDGLRHELLSHLSQDNEKWNVGSDRCSVREGILASHAVGASMHLEMQAGFGWAKDGLPDVTGQSLAEIQAEARRQAAADAAASSVASAVASAAETANAAAAQALEEAPEDLPPLPTVPWASNSNAPAPVPIGFWDSQAKEEAKAAEKLEESDKADTNKGAKKKLVVVINKKNISPAEEFDAWCNDSLEQWGDQIDVPTFACFLKDIESPYEVKDYVKFYLGETKEANDFARNFLEKRSKLLRVGMVTPSDDLCSPAIAINPRNTSNSDYQETKGKGKKTKKNKMLKVDARILGFSVTASEDRINVGDIDTA